MPEKAQPMILRDIGELLGLLRALMLETEHILKMMEHLMNEKRKLERCGARPVFRQIDGMCGFVIECQRIALRECRLLIAGGEPGSGKREQSPKTQRCNLRRRHEPQKGVLTDCRKIEFGRKPGFNGRKHLSRGIAGVPKMRLRPDLCAVGLRSYRWKARRVFGAERPRHCHREECHRI